MDTGADTIIKYVVLWNVQINIKNTSDNKGKRYILVPHLNYTSYIHDAVLRI
jgi:hypothetical protein